MKKRLLSLFLAFVTLLGILPTAALAANTEEEALGEVDIYNGGYELSYLTINGRIRTQDYTYFNYVDAKGQKKEVPAYCVNPNIKGVPQTVGVGESIKYLANERSSDPKVVGIISNGYPHRSLGELKLDNKYQAYYATAGYPLTARSRSPATRHRKPTTPRKSRRIQTGSWPASLLTKDSRGPA